MLRSLFFSAGLFVTLCGVSLLFVDKIVLTAKAELQPQREQGFRAMLGMRTEPGQQQKVLDPPDWAAFSLLSLGSVTMLYAFALPKKGGAKPAKE